MIKSPERLWAWLGALHGGLRVYYANSAIRAATIGLRASLIFAMAVWLSPAEIGLYGVISAVVALTTYFYGLDFYTFTLREISVRESAQLPFRVRDQFLLFSMVYPIGGSITAGTLYLLGIDTQSLAIAVALTVVQHAGIELYRILARVGAMMPAAICLLLRDAAWVPACAFYWLVTSSISLSVVLSCWLGGSLAAVCYAMAILRKYRQPGASQPVDMAWIKAGVRAGLRMFPGTAATRALFSLDRIILAAFAPADVLGAYSFFVIACSSAQGFFETTILPPQWARLLESTRHGSRQENKLAYRNLRRSCLGAAVLGPVAIILIMQTLLVFVPHETYKENIELLYLTVGIYAAVTLANIPHYALYAQQHDRQIVMANTMALFVFLGLSLSAHAVGWIAVPFALLAASLSLFGFKFFFSGQLRKQIMQP